MDSKVVWQQINSMGYRIKKILAWVTIAAVLVMLTTLVVEAEWSMMSEDVRTEIVCSEELNAAAYLAVAEGISDDLSDVSSLIDDCHPAKDLLEH